MAALPNSCCFAQDWLSLGGLGGQLPRRVRAHLGELGHGVHGLAQILYVIVRQHQRREPLEARQRAGARGKRTPQTNKDHQSRSLDPGTSEYAVDVPRKYKSLKYKYKGTASALHATGVDRPRL